MATSAPGGGKGSWPALFHPPPLTLRYQPSCLPCNLSSRRGPLGACRSLFTLIRVEVMVLLYVYILSVLLSSYLASPHGHFIPQYAFHTHRNTCDNCTSTDVLPPAWREPPSRSQPTLWRARGPAGEEAGVLSPALGKVSREHSLQRAQSGCK